jgi:hypothetical protein
MKHELISLLVPFPQQQVSDYIKRTANHFNELSLDITQNCNERLRSVFFMVLLMSADTPIKSHSKAGS